MKTVRLYRNPDCPRCARYAARHHRLDWLDRFEDSVDPPATGPVRKGRIAIQDLRTGRYFHDADGFDFLFSQIPVYWPLRALTWLPGVRRKLEGELDPGVRRAGAAPTDAGAMR